MISALHALPAADSLFWVGIIINSLAAINSFVISSLLITRKNNVKANYFLAAIFFLPGLNFIHNLFIFFNQYTHFPAIVLFLNAWSIFLPFLIYRYTLFFTGNKFNPKHPLHLINILAFVYVMYFFYKYLQLTDEQVRFFIQEALRGNFNPLYKGVNVVFITMGLIYVGISWTLSFRKYKESKSAKTGVLNKYRYIFIFNSSILLFIFSGIILYGLIDVAYAKFVFMPLMMMVVFFVVLFAAKNTSTVFAGTGLSSEKIKGNGNSRTSDVLPVDCDQVLPKIHRLIEKQVYLNPDITLKQFARQAGLKPYLVSGVLKQCLHQSFVDFINSQRIEYAKTLLKSEQSGNLTIEGIALSSGFKSRASFYRAFKKYTGQTPTAFIEAVNTE